MLVILVALAAFLLHKLFWLRAQLDRMHEHVVRYRFLVNDMSALVKDEKNWLSKELRYDD